MRRLHQDAKVESLGRCPLFEGLSRKQLTELARLTEDVECAPPPESCRAAGEVPNRARELALTES